MTAQFNRQSAKQPGILRVVIASPGDCREERALLLRDLERLFRVRSHEKSCGRRLVVDGWEDLPSRPGFPQDIINHDLLKNADIVLAVFGHRLGTPTIDPATGAARAPSGTAEEILFALEGLPGRPLGMLYVPSEPPALRLDTPNLDDAKKEWDRLQSFLDELSQRILVRQYTSPEDLLDRALLDIARNAKDFFDSKEFSTQDDEQISETYRAKKKEIVMYWGYRPIANEDLKKDICAAKDSIFVAGMGLNTVSDVLNDREVCSAIANNMTSSSPLEMTVLLLADPRLIATDEEGRIRLAAKLASGRDGLIDFRHRLISIIGEEATGNQLRFITYGKGSYPRHFLLATDGTIYAGAYLSHRRGKHSYLMKLRNYGDGLFNVFHDEIKYLRSHAENFEFDSFFLDQEQLGC